MIITLGGSLGSGKGTVGRLLVEKLGYKYYSMGDIWGETAKEHGMSLNEFHEYLQKNPEYDYKLDEYQKGLGKHDNIIIDSRLGFHFVPHALKVFLYVDPEEGARRVFATKRDDERYGTLEQAKKELHERAQHEKTQYINIYKVDITNKKNYDLVIDTTKLTPEQVAEKILAAMHTASSHH